MPEDTAEQYMRRLEQAAAALPADRREELISEIGEHIAAAQASGAVTDEASLRVLLDRLGDPQEIVAAAADGEPAGPSVRSVPAPQYRRPGIGLEVAAFVLMTVGSLVPLVGWLVGVVLMWTSRRLTVAEKAVATALFPGGPLLALYLGGLGALGVSGVCTSYATTDATGNPVQGPTTCTGTTGIATALVVALLVAWVVVPFVVAAVLLRRVRRRADAEPPVPVSPAPTDRPAGWGALEVAAVLLLALGAFVAPLVGQVAGLVCTWVSTAWTTTEKWVVTAILSATLLAPLTALLLVHIG